MHSRSLNENPIDKNMDFRILVVEDDAILRKVIASLFAKFAIVDEAESGNEAIQFLKTNRVDLIFSDVCMPDGTGLELLEWANKAHATAPVIVLVTGQAQISPNEAVHRGAHTLVDKPFKIKDLMQIAQTVKREIESGERPRSSIAS